MMFAIITAYLVLYERISTIKVIKSNWNYFDVILNSGWAELIVFYICGDF